MIKTIEYQQFLDVDIRVGTIIKAEINNKLNKPAMVLVIDLGKKIGLKKSSAQITANYNPKDIINKQVATVVNFKAKQIGNINSEVLVLGFPNEYEETILISPDKKIKNGVRLY